MNPNITIIAGDPMGSLMAETWRTQGEPHSSGAPYKMERVGQDRVPHTLDLRVIDEFITVSAKAAFAMARTLAREKTILLGQSAGVIAHAAMAVARRVDDPNAFVVTLLCATGECYPSKVLTDEWMRETQMRDASATTMESVLGRKDASGLAMIGDSRGATVRQAIRLLALHDVSQVPVMEGSVYIAREAEAQLASSSLNGPRVVDQTMSDVMDQPFPTVDADQPVESVAKLPSKSNRAVLMTKGSVVHGIVTRFRCTRTPDASVIGSRRSLQRWRAPIRCALRHRVRPAKNVTVQCVTMACNSRLSHSRNAYRVNLVTDRTSGGTCPRL